MVPAAEHNLDIVLAASGYLTQPPSIAFGREHLPNPTRGTDWHFPARE